jgi:hypothetical protein
MMINEIDWILTVTTTTVAIAINQSRKTNHYLLGISQGEDKTDRLSLMWIQFQRALNFK